MKIQKVGLKSAPFQAKPLNYWASLGVATLFSFLMQELAIAQDGLPRFQPQSSSLPFESHNVFNSDYILGAGDKINIVVFGYEEYSLAQEILPDGTITLPILGSVNATGHTLNSLDTELTVKLDRWLVEPDVTISLNERRPIRVAVTGAVRRPGPAQLQNNSATVSAAIAEAGGVTRNADIRQVMIMRTLPNGERVTASVNLWDLIWSDGIESEEVSANQEELVIRDGDEIYVAQLADHDPLDQQLMARSSLAPDRVRVRVVGEVRRPGEVEVTPDSSISGAIATAGGPTNDAVLKQAELIRLNATGDIERQEVNLETLTDEIQVQDGDVIVVPKSGIAAFADLTGRVLFPFSQILNIFGNASDLLQ